MKTREQIEQEIQKLSAVCAGDSEVPDSVRYTAQYICHTLSWVLHDDVSISPYYVFAGCCCFRPTKELESGHNCALGPNMCLNPGKDPLNPSPFYVRRDHRTRLIFDELEGLGRRPK